MTAGPPHLIHKRLSWTGSKGYRPCRVVQEGIAFLVGFRAKP